MLSVTAANVLAVADSTTFKHPPSILPPCLALVDEYIASAWAIDNSVLYLSSAQQIARYDPTSNQLEVLYIFEGDRIRCLVAKDPSIVIFCAGKTIYSLECGGSITEATEVFTSQKADILSLSLSNDSTLLASASHNAIYIHDLVLNSRTALRGISPTERATLCAFHPHTRTRLLVCTGKNLVVFDIARPSSPSRIISLGEAVQGDITTLASSPFSKTLVAVATSDGCVGLIDLDKEKGLFRTLNLKEPLTTIAFSPEGATIYLGTHNGRLLIQDLRSLDKVPRSIVVSESGKSIRTLAVQRKLKTVSEDGKPRSSPKVSVTKTDATPAKSSPAQLKSSRPGAAVARRTLSNAGTPKRSPSSRTTDPKKVLSPSRDPQGNSPILGLGAGKPVVVKAKKSNFSSPPLPSPKARSTSKATVPAESTPRPSFTKPRKMSITELIEPSITTQPGKTTSDALSSIFNPRERSRIRTSVSSTSLAPPTKSGTAAASRARRSVSSASASSVTSQQKRTSSSSPIPPVPSLPAGVVPNPLRTSTMSKSREDSRTPSPDLPDMKASSVAAFPTPKKKGMAVLGLGTPEVKAWIKAGQPSKTRGAKGVSQVKSVGFKGTANGAEERRQSGYPNSLGFDEDEVDVDVRERSLSIQITPRRTQPTGSSSQTAPNHTYSQSWDASPLRPRHAGHMPGTTSTGNAHELLKTILKDVMYDFQKETKAEMMGLHLDLVRMGRGWKQELRTLMEEYVGDLNDLREENRRLREENERLRRGY